MIDFINKELIDTLNDNKEIVEQIKQDHESELKTIDYAIDVKTGKVKDNDMFYFYSEHQDINTSRNQVSEKTKQLRRKITLSMIDEIKDYRASIKKYKNKKYTNLDKLNKDIYIFNTYFDNNYYNGFNTRAKDLLDTDIAKEFIQRQASAIAHIQADSIIKIGIDKFIKLDLKDIYAKQLANDKGKETNLYIYIDLSDLENIQDFYKANDLGTGFNEVILRQAIYQLIINDIADNVNQDIKENKDIYNELHKLYTKVNQDILDIVSNFKTSNDSLTIGTSLQVLSNTPIVRNNLKLPQMRILDFDIMKLFNNIYPNYKFKSIDDDRHKEIDIKAELMFDLDLENTDNLEDFRLVDFIKRGNIQLFPIQSALIEGFISIRDTNQATDKAIPLLSTLKYINDDKTMRLPTKKGDLELYEDFMLFFNRCKIQIKIENRKTKEVLFEILKPIPLLANTPAYKEGKYGYIIGNSVLNILKNELDEIYSTPKITTHQTSKQYLNANLPHTPPITNMTQFIYPKIAQMINTYKTKKTYQGKVNISNIYDFQALYRKHNKPTIDDKRDAREMLNKVLDYYIKIGLIISYEPIKKGRDIEVYKIEINKNATI